MNISLSAIFSCKTIDAISCPAVPALLVAPDRALIHSKHAQEIGYAWPWVIIDYRDGMCWWIYDKAFVLKTSGKLVQDKKFLAQEYAGWQGACREFYAFIRKLEKNGIVNLREDYAELIRAQELHWAYGLIPEYFRDYCDVLVKRILDKYGDLPGLQTLLLPEERSWVADERLSVLKLALLIKQGNNAELTRELSRHRNTWYFMRTNYADSQALTEEYFLDEAKRLAQGLSPAALQKEIKAITTYESTVKAKKSEALRMTKLSKEDQEALLLVAHMASWQDGRKKAGNTGVYWTAHCLREAAQQLKIPYETLLYTTPEEVLALLDGKKLDLAEIRKRKERCAYVRYEDASMEWIPQGRYPDIDKMIARVHPVSDVVKGMCASKGKARGKVRIVLNAYTQSLEQGEILVTGMTRPEFVPLMRKAAAIVTDEGGVTSHAAVISRELGIPCIIGTRNATKALKDGDTVEVDADKGIVRKTDA